MLLLFLRDLSDPLINDAHDTAIHSPLQPLEYNTKTVDVISWHFSLHWIKKTWLFSLPYTLDVRFIRVRLCLFTLEPLLLLLFFLSIHSLPAELDEIRMNNHQNTSTGFQNIFFGNYFILLWDGGELEKWRKLFQNSIRDQVTRNWLSALERSSSARAQLGVRFS